MNEHTTVSAKQLCTLVFLSLAVDMAVRPFTSGGSAGAPPETLRAVLTAGTAVLLACTVVYGCVMEGFYAKKRV